MIAIENQLREVFARVFGNEVAQLPAPALAAEKLETWDSMAMIALVAEVENEFSLEIPPERVVDLLSFDSMLRFLNSRTATCETS